MSWLASVAENRIREVTPVQAGVYRLRTGFLLLRLRSGRVSQE